MKSIIILCTLALTLSQNPIPAPNFDISQLEGQWNVVWTFNEDWNSEMSYSDCSMWKITVDGSAQNGGIGYEGSGWGVGLGFTYNASQNSVWKVELGNNITWIAYDPNLSWISGVSMTSGILNNGFVLSRTANLSKLIINSQILLMKAEGFGVNATNQHYYNNAHNESCIE